jgi:hypothetical protein
MSLTKIEMTNFPSNSFYVDLSWQGIFYIQRDVWTLKDYTLFILVGDKADIRIFFLIAKKTKRSELLKKLQVVVMLIFIFPFN